MFPLAGTFKPRNSAVMRVLGVTLLQDFWRRRPRARGPLTALHAILSESAPTQIHDKLGALIVQAEGNAMVLHLPEASAEIDISFSPAAEVVKIDAVRPKPNGKDRP
jgi:hypothetical protein